MTPAAKATYLSALLIGLSVGLLLGYRQESNDLRFHSEARIITAPFVLRDFSQSQYMHADSEHAKAALLACANLLEEIEKMKAEKSLMPELRDTYTRLALLEDTGNNPEQSHAYMTKARYWNSALGDRDYSESELKATLIRIDGRR
jgi:hypothetical protein